MWKDAIQVTPTITHKQSKDLYVIYFFAFLKKKHGDEESLL